MQGRNLERTLVIGLAAASWISTFASLWLMVFDAIPLARGVAVFLFSILMAVAVTASLASRRS